MGLNTLGPPTDLILSLAQAGGVHDFVETGTFCGDTTRWAARHFKNVYTVECAESLYTAYHEELESLGNVKPLLGDSRDVLPRILDELKDRPGIFWLDGHYSGVGTAGKENQCPVLEELRLLSQRPGDIILIDDARLFLAAPPPPNNPRDWPIITEILASFQGQGPKRFVQIFDDVIFITPDEPRIKDCLTKAAQRWQVRNFAILNKVKMKLSIWNTAWKLRRKGLASRS